jgi:hypothetical protein
VGKWIQELSSLVWELCTQPSKATGQLPFFLIYGSEAIFRTDIMWKSPRLEMYEEGKANQARYLELDSAKEVRCNALLQSARYYKASDATRTTMYRRGHSTLVI